jgi:thioesterase domain-containing protein
VTSTLDSSAGCDSLLVVPAEGPIDEDTARAANVLGFHLEGALPPLVLIRTWAFEVEKHRNLAAQLGPDQPLYSIAPPRGDHVEDFPTDVDTWSNLCLKRVAPIPRGDGYWLGGWSFGGVIALEMAEKLAARDGAVRLVAMLDTRIPKQHPKTARGKRKTTRLHKISTQLSEYVSLETQEAKRAFLRERWNRRLEKTTGKLRKQRDRLLGRDVRRRHAIQAEAAGGPVFEGPGNTVMSYLKRAIRISYLKYRPHETRLPVAQFWTTQSLEAAKGDATLGWAPFLRGRFESIGVPGRHHSMFDPGHVEALSDAVARSLRHARE